MALHHTEFESAQILDSQKQKHHSLLGRRPCEVREKYSFKPGKARIAGNPGQLGEMSPPRRASFFPRVDSGALVPEPRVGSCRAAASGYPEFGQETNIETKKKLLSCLVLSEAFPTLISSSNRHGQKNHFGRYLWNGYYP